MKLAPLTTAIFAGSPWKERVAFGGVTYRGRTWLDVLTRIARGSLPAIWSDDCEGFTTYVDWALDVPMFLFKRDGQKIVNTGQSFRSFWKDGYQGVSPHAERTGRTHLQHAASRSAAQEDHRDPRRRRAAARAGLRAPRAVDRHLLRRAARSNEAEALVLGWTHVEVSASRQTPCAREGLRDDRSGGAPMAKLAERLVEIAEGGPG